MSTPIYQVRARQDQGWEDCSLLRYEAVGRAMRLQPKRYGPRWERRIVYAELPAASEARTVVTEDQRGELALAIQARNRHTDLTTVRFWVDAVCRELEAAPAAESAEHAKSADEIEDQAPTHSITACYFPGRGEAELSWERLDNGLRFGITIPVTSEQGSTLANVVWPCVNHSARSTAATADAQGDERAGCVADEIASRFKVGFFDQRMRDDAAKVIAKHYATDQALRDDVEYVVSAFERDEAAGYRSKDRQFAIEILRPALTRHQGEGK